ncbi:hypothetical protein RSSM_01263 [Rhodopirellula sallentina SM41]|uniref:Uncharacterized protein n=1 Tax=Rhodopirellula sallentina SM41 TaxID=1263870 RepID=M5UHG3_9BACT|nr:hypothetical protein RSSM_01263 [Rhodopirellula sallentina SM41]
MVWVAMGGIRYDFKNRREVSLLILFQGEHPSFRLASINQS